MPAHLDEVADFAANPALAIGPSTWWIGPFPAVEASFAGGVPCGRRARRLRGCVLCEQCPDSSDRCASIRVEDLVATDVGVPIVPRTVDDIAADATCP